MGSGQHATVALQPCPTFNQQTSAAGKASDSVTTTDRDAAANRLEHGNSTSGMLLHHQEADNAQNVFDACKGQSGVVSEPVHLQPDIASKLPFKQQQDRYLLDHRIHQQMAVAPAVAAAQPAVVTSTLPGATAVALQTVQRGSAPIDILRRGATDPGVSAYTQSTQPPSEASCLMGSRAVTGALGHAASSTSIFTSSDPPNARKGMVLLDPAMHTRTSWEVEAVMVLLNGHWPARGLLSGRWPPHPQSKPPTPDTVLSTSMPESPLGTLAEEAAH